MYSLHVTCAPEQVDALSGEFWEAGTCGVREIDLHDGRVELIAGFDRNEAREDLLRAFGEYSPRWVAEADTDWVAQTRQAWPGRSVARRLFLAAPWCDEPTPAGRIRIIHNPGLACGTGEHPCTRLALEALERVVTRESTVADIGTGSGMLAIAALRLGAKFAYGADPDEEALQAARQNFERNQIPGALAAGSADCLRNESADVVVANISASVLLTISDDLLRIVTPDGKLILTGFQEPEANIIARVFPPELTLSEDGWTCFISRAS